MLVIDRETDTVTMSRAEYEALIEAAEDAEDLAHLAAEEARRDHLPGELVERMLAGEHLLRLWREQGGLSLSDLATRSGKPGGEGDACGYVAGMLRLSTGVARCGSMVAWCSRREWIHDRVGGASST